MTTKKYNFDEMANRYIDHCRKWDQKIVQSKYPGTPKNFIPMWIADMDFASAPEINDAFIEIAQNGAYGYTYAFNKFFESVISWYKKRNGIGLEKDWITLSYGTVSTIHYLYQAFCQPNDSIIVSTPVYDPFSYAAKHNGLNVIHNTLIYENNRYFIDYELLEKQLKYQHPRIYLFCSPHNPSGRIWEKEEIEKVAYLCKKYNVLFVCDEVHSEIVLYGKFVSALQLPKKYFDNLIVLHSPNKAFNLGGLKTSYSIIPNSNVRQIFKHRLKMNSITSPNLFGVIGLTTAYTEGEAWLEALTNYIRENYEYTKKILETNINNWNLVPMEASYLPWVDISKTGKTSTEIINHTAKKAGVILEPGTNYTADGDNFIRLNIGTTRDLLIEALDRLVKNQQ